MLGMKAEESESFAFIHQNKSSSKGQQATKIKQWSFYKKVVFGFAVISILQIIFLCRVNTALKMEDLAIKQQIRQVKMELISLRLSLQELKDSVGTIQKIPSPYPPPSFFIDSIESTENVPALMKALYPWIPNAEEKRNEFFNSRMDIPSFEANKREYPEYESIRYTVPTRKVNPEKRRIYRQTGAQSYSNIMKQYKFKTTQSQLPICVIVMHYNNNASFRIESNMNSIFLQNYTNYKVIIIDDASNDGTPEIVQSYLDFYKIPQTKAKLVVNPKRLTGLQNLYLASTFYCGKDDIAATVDGDDELIGTNVFNLINGAYQTRNLGVAYGQLAIYQEQDQNFYIFPYKENTEYSDKVKKEGSYRKDRYRFSNLRTYRTELFRAIKKSDLLDQGEFLKACYDEATMFAMLEMACGHSSLLDTAIYLAHRQTGLNDGDVDIPQRKYYKSRIRYNTEPYKCLKKYKNIL